MLVELTYYSAVRHRSEAAVLVNSEAIIAVKELGDHTIIYVRGSLDTMPVAETFAEVKKRLGMTISPRAETIMKP